MTDDGLAVFLNDRQIGTLTPKRSKASFSFLDEIVQSSMGSPMLSCALLVQRDAFNSLQTGNWFTGLLPEDTRLTELCRIFGVPQDDYLAVLKEVGWECAGAVSVKPQADSLATAHFPKSLLLSQTELAQRLDALPGHPYDDTRTLRISLGGFQAKLCIIAPEPVKVSKGYAQLGEVGIPLDGAMTTHILKPQPEQFSGMIEGEAWAMAVASQVTSTAETALLKMKGAPLTLVVRRFDRVGASGNFCRLHQEDCAQAMGLGPLQKYAASGSPKQNDPSFLRIASLLRSFSLDPGEELKQLFIQMLVNIALGNTDAHAKNYAFLHPTESTICLSPLYDVVPAREITPKVLDMGMRVDGRIRIDRIERDQVINEARSWGLPASTAHAVLKEVTEKIRCGIDHANDLYPQAGNRHAKASLERLEKL